MSLSKDLISQFVKATKDATTVKKESTVYGTVVKYNEKTYVKIDGSDLLTPAETLSSVEEGERVSIMIKDHTATITGNYTAPSASSIKVDGMDADLKANTANIKNLVAKNAEIENLVASKATIEDLRAANAEIDTLKSNYAEIENLKATKADVTELNAANANISTLTGNLAEITTLVNGNLTSDNIQSMVITGDKFTVENGFIKNAMIDSVNANKINTGVINTNNVKIQSNDGSMILQGNLQQFKDKNGKVRIQIGKDATGNFTFVLYDENGTGQLINQNGIQSSNAIADGLIVDSKVADNANIAGSKLDIESVVTEINDGTTTIKGTKIYLDDKKQTLDLAFNNLSTTVENLKVASGDVGDLVEKVSTNTTNIQIAQGQINTLISNTTITKENGEVVQLKDEYNATKNTVNSHSTKIGSLETNLATANNNISSVSSKQTALEQNLNGFKQTVSETYTTKAEFNELSVGGTNLQRLSSPYLLREKTVADCWTAGRGILSHNSEPTMGTDCYWLNISSTKDNSFTHLKTNYRAFKIEEGKKYSYSIDYSIGTNSAGIRLMIFNYNDSKSAELFSDRKNTAGQTYKKHKEGTWIATWTGEAYLCIYNTGFINKANEASNVLFDKIKFEEGSIPTNWDPAPQDLNDAINTVDGKFVNYSTTSQMNSAINQKANEITSSVSQTYATKTALKATDDKFANYSTTSQMNSAINQKANEITSTVSETYATKTTVTDLSNNVKNNYSTTTAMNSAINQKANEITNTVSETYAKKEDVTSITDNIGDYMINISKSTILLTSDLDGNITN